MKKFQAVTIVDSVWMKKFQTELDVVLEIKNPVPLYCDNTEAVAQVKKSRSYHKFKHILRCFYLVHEIIERQDIIIERVETKNNIADLLAALRSPP